MSAKIQPKKWWLAGFSAKLLLCQPKVKKTFGGGIYTFTYVD